MANDTFVFRHVRLIPGPGHHGQTDERLLDSPVGTHLVIELDEAITQEAVATELVSKFKDRSEADPDLIFEGELTDAGTCELEDIIGDALRDLTPTQLVGLYILGGTVDRDVTEAMVEALADRLGAIVRPRCLATEEV